VGIRCEFEQGGIVVVNYAELREQARTGGVILIEGRSFVSRVIRAATGQNISHVALLYWEDEALMLAEMREFKGYVMSPASQRLQNDMKNCHVYYGSPPDIVVDSPKLREAIFSARTKNYGYMSLFKVLWSQFRATKTPPKDLVCSTYIAMVWTSAGYKFIGSPDPGDYMRLCTSVTALDLSEHYA